LSFTANFLLLSNFLFRQCSFAFLRLLFVNILKNVLVSNPNIVFLYFTYFKNWLCRIIFQASAFVETGRNGRKLIFNSGFVFPTWTLQRAAMFVLLSHKISSFFRSFVLFRKN
jgi:hypothetical protein